MWTNTLDLSGVCSRATYWFAILQLCIIAIPTSMLFAAGLAALSPMDEQSRTIMFIILIPILIWFLIASTTMAVRRTRDLGVSGWWYVPLLLLGMIPFGFIVQWIAFCLKTDAFKDSKAL